MTINIAKLYDVLDNDSSSMIFLPPQGARDEQRLLRQVAARQENELDRWAAPESGL